jgi:hypothetical protein
MKRNLGLACLAAALSVACAMSAGCGQPGEPAKPAPRATPAGGWTVVYTGDFRKDAPKLPAEWQVVGGEARIERGALVLKGPEGDFAQLLLLEPRVPGSVRLECVASLTGNPISDISPFLNADASGYGSGYLFQFGGKGNTLNCLCRCEEDIGPTVKDKPLVKPGQKHHLLVENDGGTLRLVIDGQEVFRYTDPTPLKGPSQDRIGFYTWGCTLTIESLTVYRKS